MKLYQSKSIKGSVSLDPAVASRPPSQQLVCGYGLYVSKDYVIIWDRVRIWILTPEQWARWHSRPTVCGSRYQVYHLKYKGNVSFEYDKRWNKIIPPRTSDISRLLWELHK